MPPATCLVTVHVVVFVVNGLVFPVEGSHLLYSHINFSRLSLSRPGRRRLERNLDVGGVAHVPLSLLEPDLEVTSRRSVITCVDRPYEFVLGSLRDVG